MLEGLSHKFNDLIKSISGKAKISEQNIEQTVEEIKIALLDADVNLRVVRRFVSSLLKSFMTAWSLF